MARHDPERARAIAELEREFREFGVQLAFFDQAVAERLGLNRTDLHVVTLLHDVGAMTAGEIAQATSLTTGAVTTVIDRLEKSGYAQRERDPADRRRVVVTLPIERRHQLAQIVHPALHRSLDLYSELSDAEVALLLRFLRRAYPVLHRETAKLRSEAAPADPADAGGIDFTAPLGSASTARLEVGAGAARLELRGELSSPDLFRAHFDGRAPAVTAEAGTVTISYARFRAPDWKRHAAEVALNASPVWEIAIRGGVSKLTADLAALQLRSFEVTGGANDVLVSLPRPLGTVPVAFSGGASKLVVRRPTGVAARLQVSGGVSKLAFDAQRLGVVGGETRLESPEYATAEDRYEVTVAGGASRLTVNFG
ncbi:MAG: MarR family winged helix-turn-helix transcriptional regulator [Anaeromyxobacteraceae bacterium]